MASCSLNPVPGRKNSLHIIERSLRINFVKFNVERADGITRTRNMTLLFPLLLSWKEHWRYNYIVYCTVCVDKCLEYSVKRKLRYYYIIHITNTLDSVIIYWIDAHVLVGKKILFFPMYKKVCLGNIFLCNQNYNSGHCIKEDVLLQKVKRLCISRGFHRWKNHNTS